MIEQALAAGIFQMPLFYRQDSHFLTITPTIPHNYKSELNSLVFQSNIFQDISCLALKVEL